MLRLIAVVFLCLSLTACQHATPVASDTLANQVGQKLMLDLRFYCQEKVANQHCKQPVTSLPDELAAVLRDGNIGGVILFADNLDNGEQIIRLIDAMQQVMREANLPPLFIALDQEGGRVARLPDEISSRFAGNMALGATFARHHTSYAEQVATNMAHELRLLGFNLNFAPTVDVNVNPQNPVINVRSYGESPQTVATLGAATVATLQQQGVMSALKHFPGHGDTHVDSHTGLPRVDHPKETIAEVDLFPFQQIIDSAHPPAMIMTAHIQYPALDDTPFIDANGEQWLLPATLSKKILTGVLREQLGYQGVIVTDALDMAGIAHYFTPLEATLKTFQAGTDIALMPFSIRYPEDIPAFWQYHDAVVTAIAEGALSRTQLKASTTRIAQLKRDYRLAEQAAIPLSQRLAALQQLPTATSRASERELAAAAITTVYGEQALPLDAQHWQLVMPDTLRCQAFLSAIAKQQPDVQADCVSLATLPSEAIWQQWPATSTLIIGDITPHHSMAEMGGMDDLASWRDRPSKDQQYQWIERLVSTAQQRQQTTVMLALRAPYVLSRYRDTTDVGLASYDYHVAINADGSFRSPSIDALVATLLGTKSEGSLPVTVK
ncbi:glycoside hydrolase family 3 N-terminal domain-containing protein [Pseudidiomarina sediminum]|uniref:glycoside hydrolase family 3 N-terminal domain-containing protein n=1 Tax=Pseudidiomarina sediminum TaxID=431675 RepID=UPI001C950D4B|nr:glycoside hydrolase family 3 N-terminal domain-containing protein [Pseudidiomarina sediminum]MBY6064092.1 hypothetical protein [Pseudidiomarina sediminum]